MAPTTEQRKKTTSKEAGLPKWHDSRARQLLETDILAGRIPLEARKCDTSHSDRARSTMTLKAIYTSRPEFAAYDYDKFSSRIASLRRTIKATLNRASDDEVAFARYLKNHPHCPPTSANGHVQWQGSEAQILLHEDMAHGKVPEDIQGTDVAELWSSHHAYYETYPLALFRDKVRQEIRTKKYNHTLKVKGQQFKAS